MNENNKVIAFSDGNIPDDECYRNREIAKRLLKQFEETARQKGAKYVRLLAFHQNELAISFYRNNGFAEYSTYYNKKLIKLYLL